MGNDKPNVAVKTVVIEASPVNKDKVAIDRQEKVSAILDDLDSTEKIPLTVAAIIYHRKRDRSQALISRIHNVSRQAVTDYIQRHNEELSILTVGNDELLANTAKHISYKAMQQLSRLLDSATEKQLMAVNAISGTHLDKYRLLSDKSTSNVQFSAFIQTVTDANKESL